MAEESAEVISDTGEGETVSTRPGQRPVEERRTDGSDFSLKCIKDKWIPITVTVVITALIITVIALAARKPPLPTPRHCCVPGWLGGIPRKCFYFSETEDNWNNSQSHCSALNASLASIDSLPELNFTLRYSGIPYHWIGLWREQGEGQPWKWTNGTKFNNLFQVRGEGQCAYLNEYGVSSSRCYSERHFICNRPDDCSRRKPSCTGGDTMSKIT